MDKSPILHRIYNPFPEAVKEKLTEYFNKFDIFLLMKHFYPRNSTLRKKGWFRTAKIHRPVDGDGNPIPWYPYPAIDFLEKRIDDNLRVFEYGGGFSTIWYAQRVENVVCVEHSKEWVAEIAEKIPQNGKIIHAVEQEYIKKPSSFSRFDIIVIDGISRRDCISPAMNNLSNTGVIIIDDFDRYAPHEYQELIQKDFNYIPFYGFKQPGYSCTAVFYRDKNCLGI
jgi:hypothetical protein